MLTLPEPVLYSWLSGRKVNVTVQILMKAYDLKALKRQSNLEATQMDSDSLFPLSPFLVA